MTSTLIELYELKLNKYRNLQKFIADRFMPCKVDAIMIGSLGTVHKRCVGGIDGHRYAKTKAKGLLKMEFNIMHDQIKTNLEFEVPTGEGTIKEIKNRMMDSGLIGQ